MTPKADSAEVPSVHVKALVDGNWQTLRVLDEQLRTGADYSPVMTTVAPQLRVFFSHSSRDSEWVQRVAAQATAAGVEIYLAEHDVQAGQHLSDKVIVEIERSDAMIVLLSKHSLASVYVQQEIGVAHHAGKLVIPVLMEEVAGTDLGLLNDREYIVLDPSQPHDGLARLSLALTRLIEHQRRQLEAEVAAEVQRKLVEARRKSQQQDMIVAGAVLLVLGLIIISGQSGAS
jgi:hypothetical protein